MASYASALWLRVGLRVAVARTDATGRIPDRWVKFGVWRVDCVGGASPNATCLLAYSKLLCITRRYIVLSITAASILARGGTVIKQYCPRQKFELNKQGNAYYSECERKRREKRLHFRGAVASDRGGTRC